LTVSCRQTTPAGDVSKADEAKRYVDRTVATTYPPLALVASAQFAGGAGDSPPGFQSVIAG
jgi:hypothetical protein